MLRMLMLGCVTAAAFAASDAQAGVVSPGAIEELPTERIVVVGRRDPGVAIWKKGEFETYRPVAAGEACIFGPVPVLQQAEAPAPSGDRVGVALDLGLEAPKTLGALRGLIDAAQAIHGAMALVRGAL